MSVVSYGLTKMAEEYTSCYVLVDENTRKHCYPLLKPFLPAHKVITWKAGEEHKTLKACIHIWNKLTDADADRKAVLINLGGGAISDIGGFAAATYKRGIAFINIPTTLLAMVDAAIGGKTGIDFKDFKNQVGAFAEPAKVYIHVDFLKTLPKRELRAGFAEVIKHYLIAEKQDFESLFTNQPELEAMDWQEVVKSNIRIKQLIVESDFKEQHARKGLNYGHTIGHAVESLYLAKEKQKLLHGEAVAIGLFTESFISVKKGALKPADLEKIVTVLKRYFKFRPIKESDFGKLLKLMAQDKKNAANFNQFTLLKGIGNFTINNYVQQELILDALTHYNQALK